MRSILGGEDMAPPVMRHGQRGFSLAEMLVVLALLALSVSIIAPAARQPDGLGETAARVAALLRLARSQAIFHNEERLVRVDFGNHSLSLDGREEVDVADAIDVSILTARGEILRDKAGIRFLPNGSSTGGAIFVTANGKRLKIMVNWLTGGVTVDDAVEADDG